MARRRTPEAVLETGPAVSSSADLNPILSLSFEQISAQVENASVCTICGDRPLLSVGEGTPRAKLMFVAEDAFSGAPGDLLVKMIEAMGLKREEVFLARFTNCYPRAGSKPIESANSQSANSEGSLQPPLFSTCAELLDAQIAAIRPEVIVALGESAAEGLVGEKFSFSEKRGQFLKHRSLGVAVMPTFHPNHLLDYPAAKRDAWEDLKGVARRLDLKLPTPATPSRKPTGRDSV